MSLDDLLQAMMGGAGQQRRSAGSAGSGDPLADMLQGILGGGTASQQGSGGLEDILGAIMGGGAQQMAPAETGGGLMDIISAILGGGASGQSTEVNPIIEGVSGKTGLSQMIVQMILSFVISKLMGNLAGGAAGQGGLLPGMDSGSTYPQESQADQGLDLDGLLEQMGQDDNAAAELAQQTGLDSQTAQ